MTDLYMVGPGHDLSSGDLSVVVPQPKSPGVRATQRTYAADGNLYEQALYVELIFTALASVAMYQDLLDQFGLLDAATANVTVKVRGPVWGFTLYNGVAVRPELATDARYEFMPRDVIILIKQLEQLVEA
jgi:hypothetical protein